jgi:hypothetical protein
MTEKELTCKQEIERFVFEWHDFPIDYWWRHKYNVPFGSKRHREMNFVDMLIEYQEDIVIQRMKRQIEKEEDLNENNDIGIDKNSEKEVVKVSKKQIDNDFDELDLSQFDKK